MNILHIAPDEKFINFTIDAFEEVWPGSNRFVIPGSKKKSLFYVKKTKNTIVGDMRFFYLGGLKENLNWCDILVIHYLTDWAAYAAIKAPSKVKVFWSGWGADYYRLIPELHNDSILPNSAKFMHQNTVVCQSTKPRNTKTIVFEAINNFTLNDSINRCIPRVDYFSSPLPSDFQLLKEYIPEFKAEFFQINYSSVEKTFGKQRYNITGLDILVGNSATVTNNHIEAFEVLSKLDLSERRIIVPLSYGDESYREKVIKIGSDMFGNKFIPVVDFMPLEEYDKLISGCSIAIMNHRRQQALGNILAALYKGMRVFLRTENPIYKFFKTKGVFIYDVDRMSIEELSIFIPLTDEQKEANRLVIDSFWAHHEVLNNIRKMSNMIP